MRTILISGANRGLGLEFARQYLAGGDKVIAGVRDLARAVALHALPGQGRLEVHALDVADAASVEAFRGAVGGQPIDILIANAGVYGGDRQDRLGDIDFDAWTRAFAVNTLGAVRLADAFVDNVAKGRDRKMVAVSSLMGSTADSSGGAIIYRSSKAALNNAWRNLALQLRDRGIACFSVHPGWVKTDMGGAQAPLTPEQAISSLRAHIDQWSLADSGRFLGWDGRELPW
jgi:NAD(P)-dependent dehydrogenase (short-subunit alcohol dehydrogenase family)